MLPRYFHSGMTSAPVLRQDLAGSLITVLDACLRVGFGSQAPVGWTKPYTGTDTAAFQMPEGLGALVRIQDDAPTTTAFARAKGFATMSDIDTGTDQWPDAAVTFGPDQVYVQKGGWAEDDAPVDWKLFADGRGFYLFPKAAPNMDSTVNTTYTMFAFGEYVRRHPRDAYHVLLIGQADEEYSSDHAGLLYMPPSNYPMDAHWFARKLDGTSSGGFAKMAGPYAGYFSGSCPFAGGAVYPFVEDGEDAIDAHEVPLVDFDFYDGWSTYRPRGWLRGVLSWGHQMAFTGQDPYDIDFPDGTELAGKGDHRAETLHIVSPFIGSYVGWGKALVQLGRPWRTS